MRSPVSCRSTAASPSKLSACFFLLSKKIPALPRFASSLPHANPTLSKQYSHAHAQTRLDAREGCTVDPFAFRKKLNTDTRRAAAPPLHEHRVCVPSLSSQLDPRKGARGVRAEPMRPDGLAVGVQRVCNACRSVDVPGRATPAEPYLYQVSRRGG